MTNEIKSEQKFVTVAGGQIAYEVKGSGPVVLCLPSLGDTRREYEKFAPALLEAGYQVILTDLRGMGQSRGKFKSHSLADLAGDIKTILDAEQLDEASLIACSVSGASAGLFAIEHPERVRGLVMFNPIMYSGSRLTTGLLVGALRAPVIGKALWVSYFKSLYPLRPVEAEYLEHIKANLAKPGAMKSIGDMCWTPRLDERISQIKVPALIYFGSKDPDFKDPQAEANRVGQAMPQAKIRVLEGAGHYPQREFPETVIPETLKWLKE